MSNGRKRRWSLHGILQFALAVFVALVLTSVCAASATNIYIAQNAAGAANGADCADALAVTFFNTAANWGTGAAQIGSGTTVHLCGTFTGIANGTMLTARGSGSSGNPVTILFESGATLTSPCWGPSGAINLGGNTFVTINGGTNGIIKNTANGTRLTYAAPSVGISFSGSNATVENLTIENIYVHTSPSDTAIPNAGTQVNCIHFSGSNILIHDNVMHDAGYCLFENYANGDGNVSIYNNNLYNVDHGWMVATTSSGGSSGPFSFYGNYVHGYANWDTTADAYHHAAIHCFTSGTGGVAAHITALNIYNNLFTGPVGVNITAHIFLEGGTGAGSTPCMDSTSHAYIYNNVLTADQTISNGMINPNTYGDVQAYNNTMIGNSSSTGLCFSSGEDITSETFENNVMDSCGSLIYITGSIRFTADNNIYANSGSNAFVCGTNFYDATQFAAWQTCIGGDSHSSYSASAGLNSSGIPQSGSAVIGAATNLTSLGIVALDRDTSAGNTHTPVARPPLGSTLLWSAGAYQFGNSASGPQPASGATAIPH